MCTHNYTYTHKAPFRTRAYTDIKGPLFSPSYRYSTDALFCEHICVYGTVCFPSASVFETAVHGVNSCRHPWHLESTVTRVCVHVHCGLFFLSEQLGDNSISTNNAQRSRTIVPLNVFVCGGGETGNEIMLGALAVCAWSLSKSRAEAGQEYQSHISWPRWAYGNEEYLFWCNVSKQGGMWSHQALPSLSPVLYLSPSFHSSSRLLDSFPPFL